MIVSYIPKGSMLPGPYVPKFPEPYAAKFLDPMFPRH